MLFDTQRPEWQPLINPVANLVYSATGDSVRDVFVAGEQVVAGGRLTKVDESKLYADIPDRGGALRQAPQARPDGAVALAGEMIDVDMQYVAPSFPRCAAKSALAKECDWRSAAPISRAAQPSRGSGGDRGRAH